jgi:Amt family ammonium transporter
VHLPSEIMDYRKRGSGFAGNFYWRTGAASLGVQIIRSSAIAAWAFFTMSLVFSVMRSLEMARVSKEEELAGLDLIEHGETEGAAEI